MTGKDFKSALIDLGLSQARFAQRLGVRPSTVSEWVSGKTKVPGYAIYAVKLLSAIAKLQEATK